MRPHLVETARIRTGDRRFGLLLVAPSVLVILLIGIFPLVYTLVVSFQQITMTDVDTSFAGLVNYRQLFRDERLWQALLHTAIIFAVALPLELALGLMMAQLFLDHLPGRQIFIALLVLPTVIAPLIAGAMWRLLLDNRYGPVNQIVSWVWGEPVTLLWTVNPALVYPAILLAEVWQWTPFMFLVLLAGLQAIPQEPYEAARVDGASAWQTFRHVTLPLLKPAILIALLLRTMDLLRVFDQIFILTEGGPGFATETVSLYIYRTAFRFGDFGYAAAMSFVLLALTNTISVLYIRLLQRQEAA